MSNNGSIHSDRTQEFGPSFYEGAQLVSREAEVAGLWNQYWDSEALPNNMDASTVFVAQTTPAPAQGLGSPILFRHNEEPQSIGLAPYGSDFAANSTSEQHQHVSTTSTGRTFAGRRLLPKKRAGESSESETDSIAQPAHNKRRRTEARDRQSNNRNEKQTNLDVQTLEQEALKYLEKARLADNERIKLEYEAASLKDQLVHIKDRLLVVKGNIKSQAHMSTYCRGAALAFESVRRAAGRYE